MKKKIVSLLLLICIVFAAFPMTACKEVVVTKNDFVFNGFESYEKDMQSRIRMLNNFGKISINFDKEYVLFGNGSAKFEPSGGTYELVNPTVIMPTYSTRYEFNYRDFSKTEKISVWVYNAHTEPYSFGIGLQIGDWITGQWWDKVDRTTPVYYTLEHGWNYIEYKIDPTYLAFQGAADITNILGIAFEFEYRNQFANNLPVLYMDDLRFHYSEEAVKGSEITFNADTENGVWTIADFEDTIQNQYLYMRASDNNNFRINAKVVNASKYNIKTTNGNNVLELIKHPGDTNTGWPRATFSGKILQQVISQIGQDIIDHPENYQLRFDYFNACEEDHTFNVVLNSPATNNKDQNLYTYVTASPYTWSEWVIDFSYVNERFQASIINGTMEMAPGYESFNFTAAPGDMIFSTQAYGEEKNARDRIYLIDNVRIVKKPSENKGDVQ